MFKFRKNYFRADRLKVNHRDQYKRFTRSKAGNFFYSFFLIAFGLFSILPMIYSILTSFKPLDELLVYPPRFFVIRPTIENYVVSPSLLDNLAVPLSRDIFNSVFISVVTTVLHVLVASMGAFVLSKSNIYGKKTIFHIIQFSLLYNSYTLAIPRYLIYSYLGMIDTYWVYILPMIPSSMGVFLMKQYMDAAVPTALIEAARIDGAGTFRVFWQLVEGGTIFSEELKTLPSAASTIAAGGLTRQGSAMAVTVIMMIPPILVYMISQGSVTKTMSSSGIK